MKRLSTTPFSSSSHAKRYVLIVAAVLVGLGSPMLYFQHVFADEYDTQISRLQKQVEQYQSQANVLGKKADSLQAELDNITKQKNIIASQITLSKQQYDKLQEQINDTKVKINRNKEALGKIIADMYVDGSISSLEMLASSKNIGDYIDQQEYRSSVQANLSSTIKRINSLKEKLEKSQADVKKVMEQQKSQKAQFAAKEAEQQTLVDKTRGDEAVYKRLVSSTQSQIESAAAQQRAFYASLVSQNGGNPSAVSKGVFGSFTYANFSGNMGCSGGYPYCGVQDSYADPWGLYNRECVSYAAWRIEKGYGRKVNHFGANGNAYQWPYSANATRVYDPQPGDAVVLPATAGFAPVGHLMVVESVSGEWIHVSQYNFYGTGEYSTMDIKNSGVIFLRF